jgi:hypothetical protein
MTLVRDTLRLKTGPCDGAALTHDRHLQAGQPIPIISCCSRYRHARMLPRWLMLPYTPEIEQSCSFTSDSVPISETANSALAMCGALEVWPETWVSKYLSYKTHASCRIVGWTSALTFAPPGRTNLSDLADVDVGLFQWDHVNRTLHSHTKHKIEAISSIHTHTTAGKNKRTHSRTALLPNIHAAASGTARVADSTRIAVFTPRPPHAHTHNLFKHFGKKTARFGSNNLVEH